MPIVVPSGMQRIKTDVTDDFNRASFANPDYWHPTSFGTPTLKTSSYYQTGPVSAAMTVFEMSTDNIHGEFVIAGRGSGKTVIAIGCSPNVIEPGISGTTTVPIYCGLEIESGFFNNNYYVITSTQLAYAAAGAVRVIRSNGGAAVAQSTANGDTCGIRYTAATNTYQAYYNGSPVTNASWVDTGNVMSHGPGRRYCMIISSTDSNGAGGCGFDSVRFYNF